MEHPSDADVVSKSLHDPAAFAALFERHATTIHQYLLRRVGWAEAESLMSETFRIAFESRHSYDLSVAHARPWLYGIATNLVRRHWRSDTRRRQALGRLGPEVTGDATTAVDERVDSTRRLRDVAAAIRALPEGERDVVVLRAWEGLSYEDIAAVLEVPTGTIKSRLNRARGRLRELDPPAGEQPVHPTVFSRHKEKLITDIAGTQTPAWEQRSRMYPRLAYQDEAAALEYLTRVFGFIEVREARKDICRN